MIKNDKEDNMKDTQNTNECTQTDKRKSSHNNTNDEQNKENANEVVFMQCGEISNLPIIEVECGEIKTLALIDSGASVSLINNVIFQKIKKKSKTKYIASNVNIKTMSGEYIKFNSCQEFSLKINHRNFKHNFFVTIEEFSNRYSIILGYDFLQKFNFILDIKDNKLKSHNFEAKINATTETIRVNNIQIEMNAKLIRKITLKPNEMRVTQLKLEQNMEENTEVIFEPITTKRKLEISKALVKVDEQNKISIIIKNLENKNVALNKSMKLGIIEKKFKVIDPKEFNESHFVNLIKADPEIIKQRREELSISDFNLENLETNDKEKLTKLLLEYGDVFSKSYHTLGATDLVTPRIKLLHNQAIRVRPYLIPQTLKQTARDQLDELLNADIISETESEYAFPFIMVAKQNSNKFRLAIDLRLLNQISDFFPYPLPLISDILESLAGCKIFITLDLHAAFHQMILPEDERHKIAVTTIFGNFHYNRVPYGLKSSGTYFQKLIDKVLSNLQEQNIKAYIDDIVIGAENTQDALRKLSLVLERLRKHNLTLSPAKCQFLKKEITYLGYNISEKGIAPTDKNITKITSFPKPKNIRKLRRFMGIVNYYRSLIPNLASMIAPLTNLTKKNTKFIWTEECEKAFKKIQNIILNKPILVQPNFSEDYYLACDASKISIGAALMQKKNGLLHPIGFFSKRLKENETKWCIYELEAYAIICALEHFKNYVYGKKIIILSDHKPLNYLFKMKNPADRITRWQLRLNEFNYEIKHIKGQDNIFADLLSRDLFNDENNKEDEDINHQEKQKFKNLHTNQIKNRDEEINNNEQQSQSVNNGCIGIPNEEIIIREQLNDPKIKEIIDTIKKVKISNKGYDKFYVNPTNGMLMHITSRDRNAPREESIHQCVIPDKLKLAVIKWAHTAHFGIERTFNTLREKYFWYSCYSDVKNYVLSCTKCLKRKPGRIIQVPLQNVPIAKAPNEFISLDIVGPLPRALNNNKYILTIICHFTRFIELYPIENIRAETIADCLLKYMCTHGSPQTILTDNGTQFTSQIFKALTRKFGIKTILTSPYNPRCNGKIEKMHFLMVNTLACLAEREEEWYKYLDIFKFYYNNSVHKVLKEKPAYLWFARNLNFPTGIINEAEEITYCNPNDYVNKICNKMKEIYKKVIHNLEEAQKEQNLKHMKKAKAKFLEIGARVFVKFPKKGKLKNNFKGPYIIVERTSPVVYKLKLESDTDNQDNLIKAHVNRIRLAAMLKPNLQERKKEEPLQETHHRVALTAKRVTEREPVLPSSDIKNPAMNIKKKESVLGQNFTRPKIKYNLRQQKKNKNECC